MSAAEDEQPCDAAVVIRWSEEAQQYSISSSASDREVAAKAEDPTHSAHVLLLL